jgi:signal transduction histidine kinase/FixJ family two-component response regulator
MTETLLLADDEEGIRKVLGIALADLGYRVVTAADGLEALELFRREAPAIVLTDIRMPGMDGMELLHAIKAERPDTEVIMITGHGDMELAIGSLKLDATDFVTKPINDDALAIALKRARERIEMRAQIRAYTEDLEQRVQAQAERLIEVERLAAVGQAVEGVSAALRGMAGTEGGVRFFNEMPCLVAIHDRALTVVALNALGRERLGERVGRPSCEAYVGSDDPAFACPVAATFASGRAQSGAFTLAARDGRRLTVAVHTVPIRSSRGEPELVMEMALDVSEMSRLREELQSAQERLASLGLMIGSISHGVKGILTGLDGGVYQAESALRRGDPGQLREAIGTVKEMAARMRRMVLDVLYVSKERPLAWSRVAVEAAVRKAVELTEQRIRNTGIHLALETGPGLGEVEADENGISAVLLNLLDNAVDACRQDRARAVHHITIGAAGTPDHVRFEVRDDGAGMTAEARQHAFDLFYSAKGASGTGLGLFIARQVIQRHGGRIDFESVEGAGTVFRIELPRTRPEAVKPPSD